MVLAKVFQVGGADMEENGNTNETTVIVPDVVVNVDNVHLASEQYEAIIAELRQNNENLKTLNGTLVHGTMFLILLCIFQFYGLLSRARKKGGV